MTKEEAITREEAIRRIKAWNLDPDDMEVLSVAIPELAKSEDERTRKDIVTYLTNELNNVEQLTPRTNEVERWLAWLEKQKENTDKEYVFRPLAGTDITIAAKQAIERANEGDSLVFAFNGMYTPVSKYSSAQGLVDQYESWLEEQNPAEIDEYEIIKKHITEGSLSSEVNKRLTECGWYVTEQKPAEWSEEDEDTYNQVYYLFRDARDEWYKAIFSGCYPKITRDKVLAWLKSLQPHWKPSKEQMEAFKQSIEWDDRRADDFDKT